MHTIASASMSECTADENYGKNCMYVVCIPIQFELLEMLIMITLQFLFTRNTQWAQPCSVEAYTLNEKIIYW